jgi:hypothetical protein
MTQLVSGSAGQPVSTARWIGKWLLQIPVYLVTSYLIQTLIGSCYRLCIKAGASLAPNYLLEHFLIVGTVGGFLAGLVGIVVFRASLLLPQKVQVSTGPAWKKPQAWTWVLPTCWLMFGFLALAGNHAHHSVLMTSGGRTSSGLIGAFFGDACYFPLVTRSQWVLQTCATQLTYTHPFLGTLAYSAAAFVPANWLLRVQPPDASAHESEPSDIAEQDEHGQIAHT